MVPWLQVYSNLPTHHKTDKLADILNLPNYTVVGLLVCMWSWAAINVPDGNLSVYANPKKNMESAIGWTKKKPDLFQSLIDANFIDKTDSGYVIHDWQEYSKEGFDKKKKENEAKASKKYRDKIKAEKTANANDDNNDTSYDGDITESYDGEIINHMTVNDASCSTRQDNTNTIHNNTIHNSTIPLSPLTPPEGNDVTDVTGTEREKEEKNVNTSKDGANEQIGSLESYKTHWHETMGTAVTDDIPTQAYTALLRAAVNKIESELVRRMIGMSATKDAPSAWLATVIGNLINDDIVTIEHYTKRYGGKKHTESESGGSFDTDEFFELALKRTYGDNSEVENAEAWDNPNKQRRL